MAHIVSQAYLASLPQLVDPMGLIIKSGAKLVSNMDEDLVEDTLMREPNNLLTSRLK